METDIPNAGSLQQINEAIGHYEGKQRKGMEEQASKGKGKAERFRKPHQDFEVRKGDVTKGDGVAPLPSPFPVPPCRLPESERASERNGAAEGWGMYG